MNATGQLGCFSERRQSLLTHLKKYEKPMSASLAFAWIVQWNDSDLDSMFKQCIFGKPLAQFKNKCERYTAETDCIEDEINPLIVALGDVSRFASLSDIDRLGPELCLYSIVTRADPDVSFWDSIELDKLQDLLLDAIGEHLMKQIFKSSLNPYMNYNDFERLSPFPKQDAGDPNFINLSEKIELNANKDIHSPYCRDAAFQRVADQLLRIFYRKEYANGLLVGSRDVEKQTMLVGICSTNY